MLIGPRDVLRFMLEVGMAKLRGESPGSKRAAHPPSPPPATDHFTDVVYLVEATDFESITLWREHARESTFPGAPDHQRVTWVESTKGTVGQIGTCGGFPVVLTITWAQLNGRHVGFFDACSQVVDHAMVRGWLKAQSRGRHVPVTNAMNFHSVLEVVR